MIFCRKEANSILENIWFLGLGYNTDEILGGKICNQDFSRIVSIFQRAIKWGCKMVVVVVFQVIKKIVLHYRRWSFYNANL